MLRGQHRVHILQRGMKVREFPATKALKAPVEFQSECSGMAQFQAAAGPLFVFNIGSFELMDGPAREEVVMVSSNTKHYKVEIRVDGKWFGNDVVFATVEEANLYGQGIVDTGSSDKFRVKETTDPVKAPQEV